MRESSEILQCSENRIVAVHKLGFVVANAAIDVSNVDQTYNSERVLLLPEDPDRSAAEIREQIGERCGVKPGVVINDSFGRAWRRGTIGTAIGAAGVPSLQDMRGRPDLFDRKLVSTEVATADQLASAASILQNQAGEGIPVILVREFRSVSPDYPAKRLIRSADQDLFR